MAMMGRANVSSAWGLMAVFLAAATLPEGAAVNPLLVKSCTLQCVMQANSACANDAWRSWRVVPDVRSGADAVCAVEPVDGAATIDGCCGIAASAMGLKEPVAGRQADKKAVWTAKSEEKRIFQDSNVDVDGLAALSARLFRASLMTTS